MTVRYPTGYSIRLVDLDTLFAQHGVDKMHPEYARRLRAWIVAQHGHIGIGSGWRATGAQPNKPGFAPEGKSFHQSQQFRSGLVKFAAVDLVARNGTNPHRSPNWSEVPAKGSAEAKRWGLHCNIGSEPWHMQPIELNGWNTWRLLGRRDPAPAYPIPDQRRVLKLGDHGPDVRMAQHIMATKAGQPIQPDGQFGLRTREAVENVQRFFRLTVNGTVDSPTWAVLDWLNAQ
jgi:hypothetical protein